MVKRGVEKIFPFFLFLLCFGIILHDIIEIFNVQLQSFNQFIIMKIITRENIIVLISVIIALISIYIVTEYFIKKIGTWNKVTDKEELFREDRVCLTGIGLIQTLIFILISFYDPYKPIFTLIIKISIILITLLFFILRGYAYIKNNSKWRWNSMKILFFALFIELPVIIRTIILISYPIIIFNVDITASLTSTVSSVSIILYYKIRKQFKIRYNLELSN